MPDGTRSARRRRAHGDRRRKGRGGRPRQIAARAAHLARGLHAMLRILLETSCNEGRKGRRQIVAEMADGRWRIPQDGRRQLDGRGAFERPAAARHLVEHHAEREDIGAVIDRAPGDLLRRHVGNRAHHHTVARLEQRRICRPIARPHISSRDLGQAEVEHFDSPVRGQHDVGGFQIAMHDALVMRSRERICDRRDDRQQSIARRGPSPRSADRGPGLRPIPS